MQEEHNILTTQCNSLNNSRGTLETQMAGFQSGMIQSYLLINKLMRCKMVI